MTTIDARLGAVRRRIAAACAAAGRPAGAVALLAVSKTFGPDAVRQAWSAGQRAFGENYIQEAVDKMASLAELDIEWHCIGPVQSNKTRLVAAHFDWVHTIDRLKIAQRLSEQRPEDRAPLQVCIQVNVDRGPNKSGVHPDEAAGLAASMAELPGLCLRGLMAIPEPAADFTDQLAMHLRTAALFHAIAESGQPGLARWDTLSLGMSADLEAAVQAGSTMLRVGTAIFGERDAGAGKGP
jgi:pyridoxal phosphate enzyme (YggS family)